MNLNNATPNFFVKIFVGGLNLKTTDESLGNYFSQYGEVKESVVMKEKETSASRGFGFVTFTSPESARTCLNESHVVDQKEVGNNNDLVDVIVTFEPCSWSMGSVVVKEDNCTSRSSLIFTTNKLISSHTQI